MKRLEKLDAPIVKLEGSDFIRGRFTKINFYGYLVIKRNEPAVSLQNPQLLILLTSKNYSIDDQIRPEIYCYNWRNSNIVIFEAK